MTDPEVRVRPAATVVLLRESGGELEAFLQRRVTAMAFAAGMTVFPGGGLDSRDQELDAEAWSGPAPAWWAERFGCDERLAAGLVCAAVRETFEECGVLLAGPPDGPPAEQPWSDRLLAARSALVDDRAALADVLAGTGWVVRSELLVPWARWITPVGSPRRYDTCFFLAVLPPGQHADARTTEVVEAAWQRPADALADWRAQRIELLPPTRKTLEQLAGLASLSAVLAAAEDRTIVALQPEIRRRSGGGETLVVPEDPDFDRGLLPRGARPEHPVYEASRPVTRTASVLLADNPSPMTLDGTNTWLLRAPDAEQVVVVDPGPDDERHLALVAEQGPVAVILLTHHHDDHSGGARRLAELTGAPVRALDRRHVLGDEGLTGGDVVVAAGLEIRVLATPGHTADSLCFRVGDSVLTGDTILGRGTTVIAQPDGRLGDYLGSLRRLAELPDVTAVLPGHGPELPDAAAAAREYLAHRELRLEQVRAALRELAESGVAVTARRVVEIVYADVDRALWPAAEWSVQAQLDYLREPS